MTITIDIAPELEQRLRDEAARAGLDTGTFIVNTLEKRLTPTPASPEHLSRDEAELLGQINLGLSQDSWQRYHELIAKRHEETLTAEEQVELIGLSDQIEKGNASRMERLVELARHRRVSLEELLGELGIQAPPGG